MSYEPSRCGGTLRRLFVDDSPMIINEACWLEIQLHNYRTRPGSYSAESEVEHLLPEGTAHLLCMA